MKSFRTFITHSIRELVFGIEDSLVSTLGTITGIAVGAQSTYIVLLSAFVLIASESTSMAAGSYLSSVSVEEVGGASKKRATENPVTGAVVMWVSYVLGGFIPVLPYFFLPIHQAIPPSILLTVITLFLVGFWTAEYTKRPRIRSGINMAVISISAALIGYLIGYAINAYFGVAYSA